MLLEYFALLGLITEIKKYYRFNSQTKSWHWDAEGLYKSALNQKRLNEEPDFMDMIVYLLKNKTELQQKLLGNLPLQEALLGGIEASKERGDITILSANCATVLNRMGFNFSGMNLEGARLAGVDWREGLFHQTNLARTDLRHADLSDSFLVEANLNYSNMNNAYFGQLPYLEQSDRVTHVSYSSDGKWLASGSDDKTIRLWQVSDGKCLRVLQEHTDGVTSVSFSADNQWLASGSSVSICLWKLSMTPQTIHACLHWTTHYYLRTNGSNLSSVTGLSIRNTQLLQQHGARNLPQITSLSSEPSVEVEISRAILSELLLKEQKEARDTLNTQKHFRSIAYHYRQSSLTLTCTQWQVVAPESYAWILFEGVDSTGHVLKYIQLNTSLNKWECFDIDRRTVSSLLSSIRYVCLSIDSIKAKGLMKEILPECSLSSIVTVNDIQRKLAPFTPKKTKWQNFALNEMLDVSVHGESSNISEEGYTLQITMSGNIKRANLRITAVGEQFSQALQRGLSKCLDCHDVDLSNNGINTGSDVTAKRNMIAINNWLKECSGLQILRLSHNRLICSQFETLLVMLSKHQSLRQVLLDYNHISFDDFFLENTLLPSLRESRLENLDLSMNYIHKGAVERIKVERLNSKKEVVIETFLIMHKKAEISRKTNNKHRVYKEAFFQNPRLNCLYLTPKVSHLKNEYEISLSYCIVGLYAYKCENKKLYDIVAGEHAFLAMEGVSKYGQRFIRVAELFTPDTSKVMIRYYSITPEEYYGKIKHRETGEIRVHTKCVLASRQELKALETAICGFRDKENLMRYSMMPGDDTNKYSCLTWAMEMLKQAQIVKSGKVEEWLPSWEVGNTPVCVVS